MAENAKNELEHRQSELEQRQAAEVAAILERVAKIEPYDVTALAALKDAYAKLGDQAQVIAAGKRLAEAYVANGQMDRALHEYEALTKEAPDDSEIVQALDGLKQGKKKTSLPAPEITGLKRGDNVSEGNKRLAQLLIEEHLLKANEVWSLLRLLGGINAHANSHEPAIPLLLLVSARNGVPMEHLMAAVAERSNLPFVPLCLCDVDAEVVNQLPREIARSYCVIPFDQMGRRTLVATANPLDEEARAAVQLALKQNVLWYLAFPDDILSVLREPPKITAAKSKP